MPEPTYLVYARLAENLVCLCCKTVTIVILSTVVYRYFVKGVALKIKLARTLWALIWCHLLNCVYAYTYHLYCVTLWRGRYTRYNPYTLFFTGLGIDIYYAVSPIPLFFLTVDRCLILLSTYGHHRCKRILFTLELVMLAVAVCVTVVVSLVELPFDKTTAPLCTYVACLMVKHHLLCVLWLKTTFGVLSLLGSLLFLILLHVRGKRKTINDRVIKLTIVVELALCVLPGLAALVWGLMFMENLSKYLGEYATMFLSIDGAVFSVLLYRLAVREKVQAVVAFSAIPHGHRSASVVAS